MMDVEAPDLLERGVRVFIGAEDARRFVAALEDPLDRADRLLRLLSVYRVWIARRRAAGEPERDLEPLATSLARGAATALTVAETVQFLGPYDRSDPRPFEPTLWDGVLLTRLEPDEQEAYRLPLDTIAARLRQFVDSAGVEWPDGIPADEAYRRRDELRERWSAGEDEAPE